MHCSIAGAAGVPLCFWDWHVAVGVDRLSHCHSLDVMRKLTLDLSLWSALLEDLGREPCPRSTGSRWESAEGAWYQAGCMRACAAVILTDWSHKVLTSLSETATSQACVCWGGEGEDKLWGWVTPQSACMWVCHLLRCVCVWGGVLGWEAGEKKKKSEQEHNSPWLHVDTSSSKAQVTRLCTSSAHLTGTEACYSWKTNTELMDSVMGETV